MKAPALEIDPISVTRKRIHPGEAPSPRTGLIGAFRAEKPFRGDELPFRACQGVDWYPGHTPSSCALFR